MADRFAREALLIGQEGVEKLRRARVAVFGAGGVGGYAIEALARSGIGALDLIDGDVVSFTNLKESPGSTLNAGLRRCSCSLQKRQLWILPNTTM